MKTSILAVAGLAAILSAAPASAEQITEPSSGLKFEKNPTIDGAKYVCLGAGIRKKLVFKVYALVFCVEETAGKAELAKFMEGPGKGLAAKTGDDLAEALAESPGFFRHIIAMPVPKAAEFVFQRNVDAETMKETFTESLVKALGQDEKPRVDAFVAMLDQDIKKGDRLKIRTKPTGEIDVGLGEMKHRNDEKIARAVWESYFGPNAVSPSLKEAVAKGAALLVAQPLEASK
jgi:hypothetical protein